MSLSRFILAAGLVILSLSVSSALLYLGSKAGGADLTNKNSSEIPRGYAVLKTSVSENEEEILLLLESGRELFKGDPVSASSQKIYLDVFDSIEAIPLNNYFSRIFPFDPRFDPYAQRVHDVFVKDETRFIYLPLKTGNRNSAYLDRQFNELLADIPYSVEYFGAGVSAQRPLIFYFIAYAASCFCFLIIFLIEKKIRREAARGIENIFPLLPALSSLAFFGVQGIICAALITAFFIMIKDPFIEFISSSGNKPFYKNFILPFRYHWILLPVFAAGFFTALYFSKIPLSFFFIVFAAALALFFISVKIMSAPLLKHKRFSPVLIIKRSFPEFTFPVFLLPFAAAALILIFSAPYLPSKQTFDSSIETEKQFENIISEDEYYAHINRQAFFSVTQMGTNADPFFPSFFFASDNLPSMAASNSFAVNPNDYPAFPLKDLMNFFSDVNSGHITDNPSYNFNGFTLSLFTGYFNPVDFILLFVLLLFILPFLFAGKRNNNPLDTGFDGKKMSRSAITNTAPRERFKGINWKKNSLYNDKAAVNLRIQKDA